MTHVFRIEATAGEIADRITRNKIIERAKIETVINHAAKLFMRFETGQIDVHSSMAGESAHIFREAMGEPLTVEIVERDGVLLDEPEVSFI